MSAGNTVFNRDDGELAMLVECLRKNLYNTYLLVSWLTLRNKEIFVTYRRLKDIQKVYTTRTTGDSHLARDGQILGLRVKRALRSYGQTSVKSPIGLERCMEGAIGVALLLWIT